MQCNVFLIFPCNASLIDCDLSSQDTNVPSICYSSDKIKWGKRPKRHRQSVMCSLKSAHCSLRRMTLYNDFDTPPTSSGRFWTVPHQQLWNETSVILFLHKMDNLYFVSSGNKKNETLLKGQRQFSSASYLIDSLQHHMLDAGGDKWKQVKRASEDNPLDGRLTLSMMITPPKIVCACMFGAANQTPICKQHVFDIFMRNWFSQLHCEWEFDI